MVLEEGLAIDNKNNRFVICPDVLGLNGLMLVGRSKFAQSQRHGLAPHEHGGCMEIVCLENGLQVFSVDGEKHTIYGGEVFITFPGEVHGSGGHPEEKNTFYWVQADLVNVTDFLGMGAENAGPLLEALRSVRLRKFKGSPALKKHCAAILRHAKSDDGLRILKMRHAAVAFFLELLEQERRGEERQTGAREEILPALEYVRRHLGEAADIGALARACYLSESHFRSLFKAQMGMTPQEYVMREKIGSAKEQIGQGARISDVSTALGFSSPSHFSMQFKKYMAMSPQEYRGMVEKAGPAQE